MSRPRILVAESERFSAAAADQLRQHADLTLADLDRAGLLAAVGDVDVLWVRLRHQIDAELLGAANRLRFLVSPTTGLNHIDLTAAEHCGVRVLSLRGETDFLKDIRATAEHTVGLILALLRKIPSAAAGARTGCWNRDAFVGSEICGKTVGIVGYGRLGQIVARYLAAFDTRVLVVDPRLESDELPDRVQSASLETLLAESHIVTLHVNLYDQTVGFFGAEQFQQMRPGAFFINTARGELVDEAALLNALREGKLGGAALDVLAGERSSGMAQHALVRYAQQSNNLIITPHIAGCTVESMAKTELFMAGKLCAELQEYSVAL